MFLKSFWYICLILQFIGGLCSASDIDERLNRSDIYLNVNKNNDTLELVAKTGGTEVFKTQVKDADFSIFSGNASKNFQVRRLAEGLLFQYRAPDLGELFDLLVSQNGDVELLHSNHTYTGWDKRRSYGIKSSGVIRNRGAQAFYSLVLHGDQIHNFGTIQSYNLHLCQHYLFNSGVLVFGEKAKGAYDLSTKFLTNKSAVPAYKAHIIENYGTIKANGKLNIKSSLSYHEYGSSDFEDLETSGGDF